MKNLTPERKELIAAGWVRRDRTRGAGNAQTHHERWVPPNDSGHVMTFEQARARYRKDRGVGMNGGAPRDPVDTKPLYEAGWSSRIENGIEKWYPPDDPRALPLGRMAALARLSSPIKATHRFRCTHCKRSIAVKQKQTASGPVPYPRRHTSLGWRNCPGCDQPATAIEASHASP
jgi:hypothetical protein